MVVLGGGVVSYERGTPVTGSRGSPQPWRGLAFNLVNLGVGRLQSEVTHPLPLSLARIVCG